MRFKNFGLILQRLLRNLAALQAASFHCSLEVEQMYFTGWRPTIFATTPWMQTTGSPMLVGSPNLRSVNISSVVPWEDRLKAIEFSSSVRTKGSGLISHRYSSGLYPRQHCGPKRYLR